MKTLLAFPQEPMPTGGLKVLLRTGKKPVGLCGTGGAWLPRPQCAAQSPSGLKDSPLLRRYRKVDRSPLPALSRNWPWLESHPPQGHAPFLGQLVTGLCRVQWVGPSTPAPNNCEQSSSFKPPPVTAPPATLLPRPHPACFPSSPGVDPESVP